ncbi:MAG TPA: hypothetical protein VL200_03455 [Lacunisphaera sp.]|nr:hypothetical protein [Lacunisphaera sp.]
MIDRLMTIYSQLRNRQAPDRSAILGIVNSPELMALQAGSLYAGLRLWSEHAGLVNSLRERFPELREIEALLAGADARRLWFPGFIAAIEARQNIQRDMWIEFTRAAVQGGIPDYIISFVLMEITLFGLTTDNIYLLAEAMRDSGRIYDYRPAVAPRILVRRYPTGALSEKVALILPSLLACAAAKYSLASNFLVAKSLGFTGGTWDKLSSIPGFVFPAPGDETERMLQKNSVAMCVTHGDIAPCDRIFYQIRSLSGSIESRALIVTSIASKQGALPADLLLLDVRYGAGAFIPTLAEAAAVSGEIARIMKEWGLRCVAEFLPAEEPNGAAIGNALEVAEAIAVMDERARGDWPKDLLAAQWMIVKNFFISLVCTMRPKVTASDAGKFAETVRFSGALLDSFKRMLLAHRVLPEIADAVCADPIPFFFRRHPLLVSSAINGTVRFIDQKRLGYFVNFFLGVGGNEFGGKRNLKSGCLLSVRAGQAVQIGSPLAYVYTDYMSDSFAARATDEIRACVGITD